MPMTPGEVAEYDQGVAGLDDNVTELARMYRDTAADDGADAAFPAVCLFLLEGADWSREELAATLARAAGRIPVREQGL